jgi:hypothetical protein
VNQVNLSQSIVYLATGESYLVIDPLYIERIRNHLHLATAGRWLDLQESAFPFGENCFAIYRPSNGSLSVEMIKDVDMDGQCPAFSCFVCDSGAIALIRLDSLSSVVERFSYDNLFSGSTEAVHWTYVEEVSNGLPPKSLVVLMSPGVGSVSDFIGSGCYTIAEPK